MKINSIAKEIIEWTVCILVAVIIALLVRYFIGTPTVVKNVSMKPTLKENQRLWLNRWAMTTHADLHRGEIITFEAPSKNQLEEDNIEDGVYTARYYNQKQGVKKFVYDVLEINKISYIKRVIALEGEHVEIKDGSVYIDGKKLEEDYLQPGVVTDMRGGLVNDFVVPEGPVFALGDNRAESTDSRFFGCIPLEKVESKVAFRFWPFNLFGKVK